MAEVAIKVPPELPASMKKFIETVKKFIPDQAIDINGLFATPTAGPTLGTEPFPLRPSSLGKRHSPEECVQESDGE
jgi:hypothetical protein